MIATSTRPQTRMLDQQGRVIGVMRARILVEVEAGPDRGKRFELEQGRVRIGSAPDNEVVLSDDTISGSHAELEVAEEGLVWRDLRSSNGSVHGAECWVREAILAPGARIRLGETTVRVGAGPAYEVPLAPEGRHGIRGPSMVIRECAAALEKYARSDGAVIFLGETGVGKDLFARTLHALSPRRESPFEIFDCATVSPNLIEAALFGYVRGAFTDAKEDTAGALERANGGTLFLDELGELPLELQPKLLRVLERQQFTRVGDRQVVQLNVRFAAATQRDLKAMVADGKFRADLYYRLNVFPMEIPPLRRRREDIPVLAKHFVAQLGAPEKRFELDQRALALLETYDWPGNVRELRNVLERAVALADTAIRPEHLTLGTDPTLTSEVPQEGYHDAKQRCVDAFERTFLTQLLRRHRGNVSRAAEDAGIPRQTLHRLMAKQGIRSADLVAHG
jgi:DNA-binding NtrC family response regulator